jgi:putative component of toxin-antitoxin plasmid stabilization module
MKAILMIGAMFFAFSFCGLQEKLKQMQSGSNGNSSSSNSAKTSGSTEKAKPTSAQQAIIDGGTETKWDEQGLSWKLPSGWKKMDVKKEMFDYESPDNAFMHSNVSLLSDDFPMDASLKATYDQALQQLKQGKYQDAKMVEIDGIPGVEFTEAPPEDKDGVRRHQWIGYRSYLGQKQQLNVMTSTSGTKFDKHRDDFTAILYSLKSTQ